MRVSHLQSMPWGHSDDTIGQLLEARAAQDGGWPFARIGEQVVTIAELADAVNRAREGLAACGIGRGDRVAIMLANHLDHVAVFFAVISLGACIVPVNVHLRGEGLRYILDRSRARAIIVDSSFAAAVDPLLPGLAIATAIWRGRPGHGADLAQVLSYKPNPQRRAAHEPDEVAMILFTSGTTGLPKGVLVSDRMLRCCAHAATLMTQPRSGDVFHAWEPYYHVGGAEVLIMAVQHRITLAMIERFSVSRFWSEVRQYGATHIHFLGGILALLLKEPPRPDDRDHPVRLAWGGGCPPAIWRAFSDRFGIPLCDAYGMTECSSFTTQNLSGKVGSVGKPLPWFDVRIVGADGQALGPRQRGEILVREKYPGLVTRGYVDDPEATAKLLRDGWVHTGDIGYMDDEGDFYFVGRLKDSIRRRGENITALEVERIADTHPAVAESAVIAVPNEIADEDVKIFLRLKPGASLAPDDFIQWAQKHMARFQLPRYVAFIDAFPKTPSERIRKDALSRDTAGLFDREADLTRQA